MRSASIQRAPHSPRRSLAVALAACGLALALGACGGSGSGSGLTGAGTTESPTARSSPVGLSRCMRSHGVLKFPDPTQGPGGVGFNGGLGVSNNGSMIVDGITFTGPALQAAEKACKHYLPGGGGPPPPVSAAQKRAALANAECMRKHGVPNFPDPVFPAGGGIGIRIGPQVDPESPAFKQAVLACHARLP